jgi:two-component system sensor histidine kinase DesK
MTQLTWPDPRERWASGWRRLVFPGIFLVYLGGTVQGIERNAGQWGWAGYLVLAAFAATYLFVLPRSFGGPQPGFWFGYWAMVALTFAELPFAHGRALIMLTYVAVLTVSVRGQQALPWLVLWAVAATVVPALVPGWPEGIETDNGFAIAIVSLAMYGFFAVVRANRALTEARAEVGRLATEAERNRIARDLHDLLGHSLTTITVKAGLARRLSDTDPERAAVEIGEVEELARRSLGDVRAAVDSYREVSLTGELASGRELLRAAGIDAELPPATDVVRPAHHELFGWVVREGLTNVVRHARASRCSIALGADSVEIVDDGAGSTASPGNGLVGLRERVEGAGGQVVVGPGPAGGWRLRVEMPA